MARNKRKNKYVNVYDKKQYNQDEKKFSKSLKENNIDWSSFKRLMMHDLCINSDILNTGYIGTLTIDQVKKAMKYPHRNWRTILDISESLMHISPHYYRLNMTYSNMALFQWGVDIYDVKDRADTNTIKKSYLNLISKLEQMNLKDELHKILQVLPYQDIFCGLLIEKSGDFFIQQLSYKMCQIQQIQDGVYNFKIDLTQIDPTNLGAYPDYVQQAYLDFTKQKQERRQTHKHWWYLPPADKQICLKLNRQWTTPYPLLFSLVRDILDLDIYKKLKLQSARTDNYKAIMVKVPIDDKEINKPMLTPDVISMFAEINRESLNDDIGMIHTLGSEGKAISFKDSSNTRNNVADAVDEVYNSAGVSKELGNGSSSGTALMYSIENDSGVIYSLYRQIERWVNRFIKIRKYNKPTFKFSFYILDSTVFNRDNVTKRYKDVCTLGVTVVDKLLASLDMTPSKVMGSFILHNDIFDYQNNFKPLTSAYQTSQSDNSAGRPTNADNGEPLDTAGEQTANNDSNAKR